MVEWFVAAVAVLAGAAAFRLIELATDAEDERRRLAFHAVYDFARARKIGVGKAATVSGDDGALVVHLTDRIPTASVRAPIATPVACVVRDRAPGPGPVRTGDLEFDRWFQVYAGVSFCTQAVRIALVAAAAAGCHVRIGARGVEVQRRLPPNADAVHAAVGHARRIRAALPGSELEALRIQATSDPVARVRFAAWDVLAGVAPDVLRDALLGALGCPDGWIRTEAARRLGDPAAMLAVLSDLALPEAARLRALRALLLVCDPRVEARAIRSALRDRSDTFRRRVLREVGRAATDARRAVLLDLWRTGALLGGAIEVQRLHARLLAWMLGTRALEGDEELVLLELAEVPGAGREAVRSLAWRGSVRAVPRLRALQGRIGRVVVEEAVALIQARSRGGPGELSLAADPDAGGMSLADAPDAGWLEEAAG